MLKQPLRLTADKREIKDFPRLLLAASFIRKALCNGYKKNKSFRGNNKARQKDKSMQIIALIN